MTEKNADVEWLRIKAAEDAWELDISTQRARRLLAHIDELEAEATKFRAIDEEHARLAHTQKDRRPTIHEIAPQIMAVMIHDSTFATRESLSVYAEISYNAAEALVAEGGRRDGLRK